MSFPCSMEQFCTRIFVPVIVTRSWLTNGKRRTDLRAEEFKSSGTWEGCRGARRMSIAIADRQVFWNFLMVNRLLTACCALWPERCSCF